MMAMQTCRLCGECKGVDEFYQRSDGKRDSRCKSCVKSQAASRRASDEYRQWLAESREARKERKRKYRREAGAKPWYERRRYDQHVEAWKLHCKRVAKASLHDAHVKQWKRDAAAVARWKYHKNPKYMLYQRLKRWMHKHLGNGLPSRKWSGVLGYTVDELKQHLERQFLKGMGWHNKGEWHIDHIRPVASYNFTSIDDPEFKDCFGLHNLRPVWAKDNLSKGDKVVFLL